ncbi:hypothetical protein KQI74_28325 [Paenibacillus barcinonensis]|uniref:hypothetical protein n=1 Tax=Paenibacillus barcinonensis TaxID=198119 RepID=UPI001C1261E2|nr:hypothetical protein [Paenibacillus barcinonensis]MBU5356162.1 hypothetical protein [Paenibacillus barcinonensis]
MKRNNQRAPFSNIIGQFYNIPSQIPLTNGYIIPAGTRVFIHTTTFLPSGEESVTIVFPMQIGGTCVAGSIVVNASTLMFNAPGGGGVQTAAPTSRFKK